MQVLAIPDIHLKPWIFDKADEIMKEHDLCKFVCLGDLVDDWYQQTNFELYEETFDKAISMADKYPESLWCYGNHDVSYLWRFTETGCSEYARELIIKKMNELKDHIGDRLAFVHRIENTIFSHAGLLQKFVDYCVPKDIARSLNGTIEYINKNLKPQTLWNDNSPIWARPQDTNYQLMVFKKGKFLQVVGHTPVTEALYQPEYNVLTIDLFSTYSPGWSIGDQSFYIIDTYEQTYTKA
jgi:hypothetical protein